MQKFNGESEWSTILSYINHAKLSINDEALALSVFLLFKGVSINDFESGKALLKWELHLLRTALEYHGESLYLSGNEEFEARIGFGEAPLGFEKLNFSLEQKEVLIKVLGVEDLSDHIESLPSEFIHELDSLQISKDYKLTARQFRESIVRENGSYHSVSKIIDCVLNKHALQLSDKLEKEHSKTLKAEIEAELTYERVAREFIRKHWVCVKKAMEPDEILDRELMILLKHFNIAWDFHELEDAIVNHLMKGYCDFFDPKSDLQNADYIVEHLKIIGKLHILEKVIKNHPKTAWIHPHLEKVRRGICLAEIIWSGTSLKMHSYLLEKMSELNEEIIKTAYHDLISMIFEYFQRNKSGINEMLFQEKVAGFSENIYSNISKKIFGVDSIDSSDFKRLESVLKNEKEDAIIHHFKFIKESRAALQSFLI